MKKYRVTKILLVEQTKKTPSAHLSASALLPLSILSIFTSFLQTLYKNLYWVGVV